MTTSTFTSTTPIDIPDRTQGGPVGAASQTLAVTGLYGTITGITITLTGLTHTAPVDLDFLLVAPDGTGFLFMSGAGGTYDIVDVTLTFSDSGSLPLPQYAQIVSGTILPTNFYHPTNFPDHPGTVIYPSSGATFATTFGGNPNGGWTLHAFDTASTDVGSLDGWTLSITDTGPMRLSDLAPAVTFAENNVNATPQLLDADVTLAGGLNQFDGGTLVVSGLLAEDTVSIRNVGTGVGQIGVEGTNVTFGGQMIGTATGGVGGDLTVTFNATASAAAIEALIENLAYQNTSDAPTATRTLTVTVTDATGDMTTNEPVFSTTPDSVNPFAGIPVGMPAELVDFDGDGVRELVVGQPYGTLRVYDEQPNGSFVEQSSHPLAAIDVGSISSPTFADVDGDGLLDLIVGGDMSALQYWRQQSDGSFQQQTSYPFGGVPLADVRVRPALGDFDGDGDLDLVAGRHTFLQGPGGTFSDVTFSADDPFASFVRELDSSPTSGDVNGDGLIDVLFGGHSGPLRLLLQNADGGFSEVTGADNPFDGIAVDLFSSPTLVDYDGDGDLDLLLSDGSGLLWLHTNTGGTTSITVTVTPENDAPEGFATADLADGRMGRSYTIREADLLAGFSDVDGDTLSVQNLTASHGALTDNGDGTWTLTPDLLFTGEVVLSYEVGDGIAPAIDATQNFDIVFQPGSGGGEEPVSVIEGTPGGDSLPGTDGDDLFQPLEGDDDVFGGDGDDSVILPGDTDGYVFVQLANGQVGVVDIDPSDGDQGSDVYENIEFIRFGDANGTDTPLGTLIDMEQPAWTLEHDDVALVAATWQLLIGGLPSEGGFEYLILSDDNPTDLNDPYYAPFNAENTYLNFATSYATGNPTGRAWFEQEFGDLTYQEAVEKAFDLIITEAALTAAGGDPEGSKQFFLDAEGYFEQVAAERIVPGGVDLADAVKIALLSSVLYEAVKADVGPYANAVNDFAEDVARVGYSNEHMGSLLQAA